MYVIDFVIKILDILYWEYGEDWGIIKVYGIIEYGCIGFGVIFVDLEYGLFEVFKICFE